MFGLNSPRKLDKEKWCSWSLLDDMVAQSYKAPDLGYVQTTAVLMQASCAKFSFNHWKNKYILI